MRLFLKSLFVFLLFTQTAAAFCGFYVAKADGELFNEASKVVYARKGNQSVITMSSDYQGAPKDFAMIIPTPKVLKRKDLRAVKAKTIDHLDAYTAPRLVEYFDRNPCAQYRDFSKIAPVLEEAASAGSAGGLQRRQKAKKLGVTIKAQYEFGIYDILILKAKQSNGLITWLKSEEYNIPNGAARALQKYIDNGMKFFVARVNLKRHSKAKKQELEPLQIRFRSKNFMLPIQLGKVNSAGTQDVLVYMLTETGQVETTNYETQKIPSNVNIPTFTKKHFGKFYKDMFAKSAGRSSVVMEYAWNMGWCDPCAADPLSNEELQELGVSWLTEGRPGQNVFVTRLHMRYDKDTMLKDPKFVETKDSSNFQGRYVMNHPYKGAVNCQAGKEYIKSVKARLKEEENTLVSLTNWNRKDVRARIRKSVPAKYR